MSSFVTDAADALRHVLAEIDTATEGFRRKSGLACIEGCGACCLKPGIEARVIEMLPAALALTRSGEAEGWYERASAAAEGACVFYQPEAGDPRRGRCGNYENRPSVCRLFGFASVKGPDGRVALATCRSMKEASASAFAASVPAEAPSFSDFGMKISQLAQGGLAELLPINAALARALEKLALAEMAGS